MKQGKINSNDVTMLQQLLKNNKTVSTVFGSATKSAVKNLQSSSATSRIVDTKTQDKVSSKAVNYTINTSSENGGTIIPTVDQKVLKGDSVTFTIKPLSGYKVKDVKVDGTSIGPMTTYTFNNVIANHVISATFTAITSGSNNINNFWQSRSTWLHPLKGLQTADPTGGARYFGAPRANGTRAHAAIDFIAPSGTLVYAMTEGKVIRTSLFFENTSAVEVQNTDGTIARYCEIAPLVSVNKIVHRGDVIGKIITNYAGTSMLHLEMYKGTASGSLTQGSNSSNYWYVKVRNYQRRADLIDPTGAKNLPVK